MYKLFHWTSRALASYALGNIIVMAKSIQEAREKAVAQFLDEFSWMLYDEERKAELIEQLRKDLEDEPEVYHTAHAVLIMGSE